MLAAQLGNRRGHLGEPLQRTLGQCCPSHLELEVGGDNEQVGITRPLAVAGHAPLHHRRTAPDRRDGVGHGERSVVVAVNPHRTIGTRRVHRLLHLPRELLDVPRQRASVRVAQHDKFRARFGRRGRTFHRKLRVRLTTVEVVFAVHQDLLPSGYEVSDGFLNHRDVLLRGDAENLLALLVPRLSHDAHARGGAVGESLKTLVIVCSYPSAAGHAERGEFGPSSSRAVSKPR